MGDNSHQLMALKPKNKPERGPIAVIEGKGVKIPIYLSPRRGKESYLLAYYAEGNRKRERISGLEEAKKRARKLIDDLALGKVHVATFTLKQTMAITDAVEILRPTGVSITEVARQFAEAHRLLENVPLIQAAQFYAKHREQEVQRGALQPITLPKLVGIYLESIETKKSKRYVADLRAKLKRASKTFTGEIRDIRASDMDRWIDEMKDAGERTRNNYRKAMLTLFSYARNKNYLPRGEQTEAEFTTRLEDRKTGAIGIYPPDQFAALLKYIDERFVPFVALGGFAGLRSIEIIRLEWTDVWFEKGFIEVGKQKSKTATRRLVPICPALAEWLKPYAKKQGAILPQFQNEAQFTWAFGQAKPALHDEEGKPRVNLVHNGLRHSFCSYRLAETKSAAQVALEAGNSPKMLFEHYRELVTEGEAKEWFGMTPNKVKRPRA